MKPISGNFKRIKVVATGIEWDTSDCDLDWMVNDGKPELPDEISYIYTKDELEGLGIVSEDIDTGDLLLDDDMLMDVVSDRLTDDTEFCHNGFGMSYDILAK